MKIHTEYLFFKVPIYIAILTTYAVMTMRISEAATDIPTLDEHNYYYSYGERYDIDTVIGEYVIKQSTPTVPNGIPSPLTFPNGECLQYSHSLGKSSGLWTFKNNPNSNDVVRHFETLTSLLSDTSIDYVYPVWLSRYNGKRVMITDDILFCLKPSLTLHDITDLISRFSLLEIHTLTKSTTIYHARLAKPKAGTPWSICASLADDNRIEWSEPDMIQSIEPQYTINDPAFNDQSLWYWTNSGQFGGISNADVKMPAAWSAMPANNCFGNPGIRVAVVDDGVDQTHVELTNNIIPGYDFRYSNVGGYDSVSNMYHGVCVAGIIAAQGNNSIGLIGGASYSKILPVVIYVTGDPITSVSVQREALIYAADNSDVLNCSWGGVTPSSCLTSGFYYAYYNGRGGLGCPVFCASGNGASGYLSYTNTLSPGSWYFEFHFTNNTGVAITNAGRVAFVTLPDGTYQRFDPTNQSQLPSGWIFNVNPSYPWYPDSNPDYSYGTSKYQPSSYVGLPSGQDSVMRTPTVAAPNGGLFNFHYYFATNGPGILYIKAVNNATNVYIFNLSGMNESSIVRSLDYPGYLAYTIDVGASTDCDYRGDYSQYGSLLDFVAPGHGGCQGIYTTDRTGAYGYSSGDYFWFGGTSAAAPIASSIAALILAKNPLLTSAQVRTIMQTNCDKIGPIAYSPAGSSGVNNYYGYGRLNAYNCIINTPFDSSIPTAISATTDNSEAIDIVYSKPMGRHCEDTNYYSLTAGQNTLASHPDAVIRIRPTIFRLMWYSGDMATNGIVSVNLAAGIECAAGNSMASSTNLNTTGTKRQYSLNCGQAYVPGWDEDYAFIGNILDWYGLQHPYDYPVNCDSTTSGIYLPANNPAPVAVYQTTRNRMSDTNIIAIRDSFLDLNAYYTVRLHFAEIYFTRSGDKAFDISINGATVKTNFDIYAYAGMKDSGCILEYTLKPMNQGGIGGINIILTPKPAPNTGAYNASINGVEVIKQ